MCLTCTAFAAGATGVFLLIVCIGSEINVALFRRNQCPPPKPLQIGHDKIIDRRVDKNYLPSGLFERLKIWTFESQLTRRGTQVVDLFLLGGAP